jgi:outer membrane receptor protein involved in Fe transport
MVAAQCAAAGVPTNSTFGTSQQRATIGGNTALKPETATVGTAGAVYEPLSGLAFTLDYWRIHIKDAITILPASTITSQCYQGGVQSFCDQVQRDPVSHEISHLIDIYQNVGGISTSGLDFSAAYQYKTSMGSLRHAVEGTYLFKNNTETGTIDPTTHNEVIIHGKGHYDLGVNPDLKFNIFTLWTHPSGFDAGLNFRFVDSYKECDNNNCMDQTNGVRNVTKYGTGDLFFDYLLKTGQGTTRVTVGMNNVINAQPPIIYNGPALNADESAYDFLGRQFYIRLSQLF